MRIAEVAKLWRCGIMAVIKNIWGDGLALKTAEGTEQVFLRNFRFGRHPIDDCSASYFRWCLAEVQASFPLGISAERLTGI